MDGKRSFMMAEEGMILTELVNKYQQSIECKKTDCISASNKKKAWATLTQEYNSLAETTTRTVEQLRKCWENIKSKRKELAVEKRQKMATGGGIYVPPVNKDEAVDSILQNVDIKINDAVDSDTIALAVAGGSSNYTIIADNVLNPIVEEMPTNTSIEPIQHITRSTRPTSGFSSRKLKKHIDEEARLRLSRLQQQMEFDAELHAAQMKFHAELHAAQMREIENIIKHAAELYAQNLKIKEIEIKNLKKKE